MYLKAHLLPVVLLWRVVIRFKDAVVAVDNVEFVGPRITNDSLYPDRFIPLSPIKVPSLRSFLGSDPLET